MRVFSLPELVDIISENAAWSDLVSLALVSRTTSQSSLRILWRFLPSTSPLLFLLSSVQIRGGKWVNMNLHFPYVSLLIISTFLQTLCGLVSTKEWERFDYYASFVHCFHSLCRPFPGRGSNKFDTVIYWHLQSLRPQIKLFPQLRIFDLCCGERQYLLPYNPFFSHSLQDVTLNRPTSLLPDLFNLACRAPYLRRLRLIGDISPQCLDLLPSFRYLAELTLSFRDRDNNLLAAQFDLSQIILNLHYLEQLNSLRFTVTNDIPSTNLAQSLLLNVKLLHVRAPFPVMRSILNHTKHLEEAILHISDANPRGLSQCVESLVETSRASLISVRLGSGGNFDVGRCTSPLMHVPTLKSFHILDCPGMSLKIEDCDIEAMVNAWPALQAFILPEYSTSNLSIKSAFLLASLRHLDVLSVPIFTRVVYERRGLLGVLQDFKQEYFSEFQERIFTLLSNI